MTSDEKRAKIRECLRRRKASLKKQGLCQDCGRRTKAKAHRIEDPEAVERMMVRTRTSEETSETMQRLQPAIFNVL